jgi:hypothetical protein
VARFWVGTITLGALLLPIEFDLGANSSVTAAAAAAAAATTCVAGPIPATTTASSTTTTSTSTNSTTTPVTTTGATTTTAPGSTSTSSTSTSSTSTSTTSTTTTLPPVAPLPAYDLITSQGDVQTFGGAGFFGSRVAQGVPTRVIGGGATADGLGYWIASSHGSVYTYGDATNFGSPAAVFGSRKIAVFATSADHQGYFAVTRTGNVYNYGDAPFCGSAKGVSNRHPIAALATTPDNLGYWLVTTSGVIRSYGDAVNYSPRWRYRSKSPIVSMAGTPDGHGYWLCNARGSVFNFGDARFFGSTVHRRLTKPIVSCTPTPDGGGYWITTGTGRIYLFGDATSHGSDLRSPPAAPTTIVSLILTVATTSTRYVPLPHHQVGYDISNFQCSSPGSSTLQSKVPSSSVLSIIEVAGWLNGADNSCLANSAAWATHAAGSTGASYQLYLFVNSPGTDRSATRLYANGPKGSCGRLSGNTRLICIAYNYGYNGAASALKYAHSQGVHAVTWWLDIENTTLSPTTFSNFSANEFWSDSTTLNAYTVQGAFDSLRSAGLLVGLYSSSLQYPKIVGSYVPSNAGAQLPLWIAGAPWTSPPFTESGLPSPNTLVNWCNGTAIYRGSTSADGFAGGVPWILQETPGTESSPYGLDPNYTC